MLPFMLQSLSLTRCGIEHYRAHPAALNFRGEKVKVQKKGAPFGTPVKQ